MPDSVLLLWTLIVTAYHCFTLSDYDQTQWHILYSRAMLELDHALMMGRIIDARARRMSFWLGQWLIAIATRCQSLNCFSIQHRTPPRCSRFGSGYVLPCDIGCKT
jgi:hypothetical protein